jgi:hypothetical protein
MFGIAAIVVMLCSFDMEYDELLANLRRAGMWLPAVVGLWIIIYLFNTSRIACANPHKKNKEVTKTKGTK